MAITRGSKLFHTILLVFAWQYCAKVGATFKDVTGFFDFDFGSFGSGGVGILQDTKNLAGSTNAPEMAPGIAPVGFETSINNEDNDASSFESEFTKTINDEVDVSDDHKINLKRGGAFDVSHGGITKNINSKVVSNDDHKVNLKSGGKFDVSHGGISKNINSEVDVSNDGHKVNLKSGGTMDVSHDGTFSGNIRSAGNIGLKGRGTVA